MPPLINQRSIHPPARRQVGLTLVELLVGIAVGLFVVAAAATLMSAQLVDNRKLLIETQIQQDLRASMDIITRQLRRAGAQDWNLAQNGLALPTGSGGSSNTLAVLSPTLNPDNRVDFSFYRNAAEQGPYGYQLVGGVIQTLVGGRWQDLTDSNTLNVRSFTVTPNNVASAVLPCPKLCPDGTSNCWPTLVVRDFVVAITAEAKNDPTVQRTMTNEVRLRNDWLRFDNPVNPVCP